MIPYNFFKAISLTFTTCLVATILVFSQETTPGRTDPIPLTETQKKYAEQTFRNLTDTEGKTMYVRMIAKSDKEVLVSRRSDGIRFLIPIEKLSQADQEFFATWRPQDVADKNNPNAAILKARKGCGGLTIPILRLDNGYGVLVAGEHFHKVFPNAKQLMANQKTPRE